VSGILGLFACSEPLEEEGTGATSEELTAATCNAMSNTAAPINSTCLEPVFMWTFAGGAVVAGTYDLTRVSEIGSSSYCSHYFASKS
jgi:hypothetical protein